MGEAVEQGRCHFGIAEDRGPFAEAQVCRDDDAGSLVELAEQMEQQRPARCTERQVAKLVEDDEVQLCQAFGDMPGLPFGLLLLKGIDQLDGGEEADLTTMVLDGLDAKGGSDVRLAGARAADKDDVLGSIHELATVEGPDG